MTTNVSMEKLARVYIRLRDEIKRVTDERDAEILRLKEKQQTVADAMKAALREAGADSMRTPYGTVWMTVKTRFYTNDWPEFNKFVKEHDAMDLFERRLHQGNMAQFLKDNPSVIPPGLNADATYEVSVRKPKP